ncbi:hypothetical protein HY496_01415 [Candidatus Woesearchaeota archaeon]|nr:hypothetical protein [Candidatus Woesearchaeota archaeon]
MLHPPLWKRIFPANTRGEIDHPSPEFLIIIILAVLIGIAFILYVIKLKGRLLP